jgi:hypothetical protein
MKYKYLYNDILQIINLYSGLILKVCHNKNSLYFGKNKNKCEKCDNKIILTKNTIIPFYMFDGIIEINKNIFLNSSHCILMNELYIKFKTYENKIIPFYSAVKNKLIDYEININLNNNNNIIIGNKIKNYNINLISLHITSEYCNKFIKNKIKNKELNYLNYYFYSLNDIKNHYHNINLFSEINKKYNIITIPKIFYKCLCYKCRKYIKKECLLFF